MAFLNGISLPILGLIIGSLAVAHARELLDDHNKEVHNRGDAYEHKYPRNPNKCYPNKYQKECPHGDETNCFAMYPEYDYVKVAKKPCFAKNSKVVVAYINKEGYPKCSDGGEFSAKCGSEVKAYMLDSSKYYNKYDKKNVPDVCKNKAGRYQACNVCEYKFKVECKQYKKPQYNPKPQYPNEYKPKYEDKVYTKAPVYAKAPVYMKAPEKKEENNDETKENKEGEKQKEYEHKENEYEHEKEYKHKQEGHEKKYEDDN